MLSVLEIVYNIENVLSFGQDTLSVQRRTALYPPIPESIRGDMFRMTQHVYTAIVTISLLQTRRFTKLSVRRQSEVTQKLRAQFQRLALVGTH